MACGAGCWSVVTHQAASSKSSRWRGSWAGGWRAQTSSSGGGPPSGGDRAADQFDLAARILHKRSTQIGQRAANPSPYGLTGLITCPQCGRKFIGTVAHGRSRPYRYYICWSRDRYGTKAGCDIHRFNADELDQALAAALLDFYTNGADVIARAVHQAQAAYTTATASHRDQLGAIARDLKEANASIDRYLTAFEKGTLDDTDEHISQRLTALRATIKQLRARKAQLELELDQPPQAPTPGDLTKIRQRIQHVLDHGSPNERKALFEGLIHKIEIRADSTLLPHFRIPFAGQDEGLALQGPAAATDNTRTRTVRALPPLVGLTMQNTNTTIAVAGHPLRASLARSRACASQTGNPCAADVMTGTSR
jgi:site-specific DNA recombinase